MTSRHEAPETNAQSLPREIERKYLLRAMPEEARRGRAIRMVQGYVPGTRIHERVRREESADGVLLRRTIKMGRGVERIEVEETIDEALFRGLFALTEGARVHKTRYLVNDGDLTWEVDEFSDRELVLAEVELPDVSAVVTFPAWLAPSIVREVTDEGEYTNLRLAR